MLKNKMNKPEDHVGVPLGVNAYGFRAQNVLPRRVGLPAM